MASTSTPTGAVASTVTSSSTAAVANSPMASESEIRRLGGIEALRLKTGLVRRNLFGPVDHRQLHQDFQRLLCMSVEVANQRWSFDFQCDRPKRGAAALEWEELRCQDVPAFYRSCTVRCGHEAEPPRRSMHSSGESSSDSCSSSGSGDEYLEVTTKGHFRIQRPEKRKQANITDFFKVKRQRLLNYELQSESC